MIGSAAEDGKGREELKESALEDARQARKERGEIGKEERVPYERGWEEAKVVRNETEKREGEEGGAEEDERSSWRERREVDRRRRSREFVVGDDGGRGE